MPKVSICVPTYNGAAHLRECLDSVVSQSHPDFEVIAIDDQSSDETWDVLNQYADHDRRIRLFRNGQNRGLVGNWNQCIEVAQGEWIKFVFQDDVLHPHCVELMLQAANRPIVFCKRHFLVEDGTDAEIINAYESIPRFDDLVGNATDIVPELVQDLALKMMSNPFGEPTAALLHKSVFFQFGRFNEDINQICDLEYWIRVATNTGLTYVPALLASFRIHGRSTSATNRDPLRVERVSVFDQLILLHEYAYNPHFASLRRKAARARPPRWLRRELAEKATWVRARANVLAATPGAPDTTWILKWDRLIERYPHIGWSIWHVPHDARRFLDKHLRWRFRTH